MSSGACEWMRIRTRDGTEYYFNTVTTLTTWDPPEPDADTAEGWILAFDQSGKSYYFNPTTKATQWEKPVKKGTLAEDAEQDDGHIEFVNGMHKGVVQTSPKAAPPVASRKDINADVGSSSEDDDDMVAKSSSSSGGASLSSSGHHTASSSNPSTPTASASKDKASEKKKKTAAGRKGKAFVTLEMERAVDPLPSSKDAKEGKEGKHAKDSEKKKGFFGGLFSRTKTASSSTLSAGGKVSARAYDAWRFHKHVATKTVLDIPMENLSWFGSVPEAVYVYCGDRQPSKNLASAFTTQNKAYAPDLIKAIFQGILKYQIEQPGLKNEIYIHIMRHLNGNPRPESARAALDLLNVAMHLLLPQEDFVAALASFLVELQKPENNVHELPIEIISYLMDRIRMLQSLSKFHRSCSPDLNELDFIKKLPAVNPVFNVTVHEYMLWQKERNIQGDLPVILTTCAGLIESLGGFRTQGVFRLPGNQEAVSAICNQFIESGSLELLNNCKDLHVVCSTFKLWLRSLAEPIIPVDLYQVCVQKSKDPQACIALVQSIDPTSLTILKWVISFVSRFCVESVVKLTSMSTENLAIVFCPNLLRDPMARPDTILQNSFAERAFVTNLLRSWR
eukprot:ANDGO_02184.mRNA.1 Mental retardation GTPase activating protein homolog 3